MDALQPLNEHMYRIHQHTVPLVHIFLGDVALYFLHMAWMQSTSATVQEGSEDCWGQTATTANKQTNKQTNKQIQSQSSVLLRTSGITIKDRKLRQVELLNCKLIQISLNIPPKRTNVTVALKSFK